MIYTRKQIQDWLFRAGNNYFTTDYADLCCELATKGLQELDKEVAQKSGVMTPKEFEEEMERLYYLPKQEQARIEGIGLIYALLNELGYGDGVGVFMAIGDDSLKTYIDEDYEPNADDLEMGFDPYLGAYTDDC